ncbi:MAG: hypothetical protein RML45_04410 [Acetobacteraceae bacterium]|nr:hypothetical protein [Acetobacteraceae bacterium]
MTAPRIAVEEVTGFEWPFTLRIPFRFGAVTLRSGRQAVVAVRVRLADGATAEGLAAETLAPKWFDKNPLLSDEQNEHQLRRAIEIARDVYLASPPATPFGLFAEAYGAVQERASAEGLPPLVAAFGQALVDRAVLDAVLRPAGLSFFSGMRANVAGLASHPRHLRPRRLRLEPLPRLAATKEPGVPPAHRRSARSDHRRRSRSGDRAAGRASRHARGGLCRPSAALLQAQGERRPCGRPRSPAPHRCPCSNGTRRGFRMTLDGNEQFADAAAALAFLDALSSDVRSRGLARGRPLSGTADPPRPRPRGRRARSRPSLSSVDR